MWNKIQKSGSGESLQDERQGGDIGFHVLNYFGDFLPRGHVAFTSRTILIFPGCTMYDSLRTREATDSGYYWTRQSAKKQRETPAA